MRIVFILLLSMLAGLSACSKQKSLVTPSAKVEKKEFKLVTNEHPRLWIRKSDLSRLRSWAVDSNPIWKNGLLPLAKRSKSEMDSGLIPDRDPGHPGAADHPTEMYAQLFAFMSLIHPEQSARDDYGKRAKTLLMAIIDQAALGVGSGAFRAKDFSTYDRSRWHGEAFGLVVDWIYDRLSAEDKVKIVKVFSRWIEENMNAQTTGHNHPVPLGVYNDAQLIKDPLVVRWSANNYYTAHMRNMALMALSLDAVDDVEKKLEAGFKSAVMAFLYVNDHFRRTDSRGGLSPEGPYYAPESISYITQMLLALNTSGNNDTAVLGPQVAISGNSYWDDIFVGWAHLYPPAQRVIHDWQGALWEPAWSADGSIRTIRDPIALFGPLGIFYLNENDESRLAKTRWLQLHYPVGGMPRLLERVAKGQPMVDTILYFMLFKPQFNAPNDPRSNYPLSYLAEGIGHFFSRTGWSYSDRFFRFICGYNSIDHQHCDGNHFGFWRKGEWLTRDRTGYAGTNPHSQYHNTLSIKNTNPDTDEGWVKTLADSGSQWMGNPSGDGKIVAQSTGESFSYITGDATALYNSDEVKATDVLHASRSIVWLKPDHIIYYDRAETKSDGKFKRLWQQLPSKASITSKVVTAKTPKNQQVFITSLLPEDALLKIEAGGGEPADEPLMTYRLKVEPKTITKRVDFLHVLQGADSSTAVDKAEKIDVSDADCVGVKVKKIAVIFSRSLDQEVTTLSYSVSKDVIQHIITGLKSNTNYQLSEEESGDSKKMTLSLGGELKSDSGGVLTFPTISAEKLVDAGLSGEILDLGVVDGIGGNQGGGSLDGGCRLALNSSTDFLWITSAIGLFHLLKKRRA